MGNIKLSSEFLKRVDEVQEQHELDAYTPSKTKLMTSEDLFDTVEYINKGNEKSTFIELKNQDTKKIILLVVSAIIIAAIIFFAKISYGIIQSKMFERNLKSKIASLIDSGTVIKVSDVIRNEMLLDNDDLDSDGDGISNKIEIAIGSNPNSKDTDGDGIGDGFEYTNPGFNIVGFKEKDKENDLSSLYTYVTFPIMTTSRIKHLDKEVIAKEIGINPSKIEWASKIYKPNIKTILMDSSRNVKCILRYIPEYNGFKQVSFSRYRNKEFINVDIGLENEGVLLAFNVDKNEVFKEISYRPIENERKTLENYIDSNGIIDYNSLFNNIDIKSNFDIAENVLNIPTIWDKNNGVLSIGQSWFTGLVYNGVKPIDYNQVKNTYTSFKWMPEFNYVYDLSDIVYDSLSDIGFKDTKIKLAIDNRREAIEIEKLPRPDKEVAGVIAHLNAIGLDLAAERLALKNANYSTNVLQEITSELDKGNTILAIMQNDKYIHSILMYGYFQSAIDEDVYNFTVYDSNINKLQILQAKICKYPANITFGAHNNNEEEYVSFRYGIIDDYYWETSRSDILLFYKINEDITLEFIG